jgi:NAD(P)-dependent dehydrogenase (short-subunit alcohol dehydrogenase family)
LGRSILLVNNAGTTKRGDFLALTDVEWNDGFALKFFGAMRLCRLAWTYLLQRQGSIFNIGGVGEGELAVRILTSVERSMQSLLYLIKSLADCGVRDCIRVNAINPGAIVIERLPIRVQSYASLHGVEEVDAAVLMAQALGLARFFATWRISTRVVAFLASPKAGYF